MSESLISNIFTDEFSDVVTTEVLKDYYETRIEETNHNVDVMNALTVLLKEFMPPDEFKQWLKERT